MSNVTATTERGGRVLPTPDPGPAVYGLDIETDTTRDGLDPRLAAVVAVAISSQRGTHVIMGPETDLLTTLDERIAGLTPGIITTWNGTTFDLPFLAERARRRGVPLGLRLAADPDPGEPTEPGNKADQAHNGDGEVSWHGHSHVDGYRLARLDQERQGVAPGARSCGLKAMAHEAGLPVVEVETAQLHRLDPMTIADYVASDAFLARELLLRRWAGHPAHYPAPAEVAVG